MTARRASVLLAAALVLGVAADELSRSATAFGVVGKALAAGVAALAAGAVAERLWQGAVVTDARLPGGVGLTFEASERRLEELGEELKRLDTRLNVRVARLEREVYGPGHDGNGAGVR